MQTANANPAQFAKYDDLPELIRKPLAALEDFIGDLDGKTIAVETGENEFIDEGTIDAEEAVQAFNVIVAALQFKTEGKS